MNKTNYFLLVSLSVVSKKKLKWIKLRWKENISSSAFLFNFFSSRLTTYALNIWIINLLLILLLSPFDRQHCCYRYCKPVHRFSSSIYCNCQHSRYDLSWSVLAVTAATVSAIIKKKKKLTEKHFGIYVSSFPFFFFFFVVESVCSIFIF